MKIEDAKHAAMLLDELERVEKSLRLIDATKIDVALISGDNILNFATHPRINDLLLDSVRNKLNIIKLDIIKEIESL